MKEDRMPDRNDALRSALGTPTPSECPYIVKADEGTAYCRLAESPGHLREIADMARRALGPNGPATGAADASLQFRYEGALIEIVRLIDG